MQWDEGAMADGEEGKPEKLIPLASLEYAAKQELPDPETEKEKAAPVPEVQVQLPPCMPWSKFSNEMAAQGMEQLVVGALSQMFVRCSATP